MAKGNCVALAAKACKGKKGAEFKRCRAVEIRKRCTKS